MASWKKKAATMSLKDFHGGSIPSDLPLPSAPGLTVRPSDRVGFDRQTSWGNPTGRSDHRLRPNSAGAARTLGDNTPFLTHSARIGRNFDEDERKPLDGVSGPQRAFSDDSISAWSNRVESRMDYSATGRVASRPVTSPVTRFSGGNSSSYASRFSEAGRGGASSQKFGGYGSYSGSEVSRVGVNYPKVSGTTTQAVYGLAVSGPYPNAWGQRKEVEPISTAWSASDAASKFAHASALDKVSSGRWHTKQPVHHQTDVEVIKHSETEREFDFKGDSYGNKNNYNVMDVAGGRDHRDMTLARHVEKGLVFEDGILVGGKELQTYEKVTSPMYSETKERNPPFYANAAQQSHGADKVGRLELQSPVPAEPSERPKWKLLSSPKPLEITEPCVNYKLGYQKPVDPGYVENVSEFPGNKNIIKTGPVGAESGNRAAERPKLKLKPRSQPLEQIEGNIDRERNTLFGGALPRELVLKQRGIDDVVNSHELGQHSNSVKKDVPRTKTVPIQTTSHYTQNPEKAENIRIDHRVGKNPDRQQQRVDAERTDVQKRNWKSDNRRNTREIEKHQHQHQQPQERPPSPETWRKPVEQPKSASVDARGLRYGKAASAVELALAFSRSISDPKMADRFSGQRGFPSMDQMPFSRLMGPTPRPRINGY